MREAPEMMFRTVKDALDRATTAYMMAMRGEADLESENLPMLVVKNTFLEVGDLKMAETKELKSQSCPIAAFSGCGERNWDKESLPGTFTGSSDIGMSELSKAARMFSTGDIPREAMEAAGLVTRRPSATGLAQEPLGNTRPLPPPLLCEPDFPEPSMPEVPQWSPKVSSVGAMMQAGPVPPPISTTVPRRPLAPLTQAPITPVPMAQNQPQPTPIHLQLGTPVRSSALFRVAYQGGVALRQAPQFDGARTGAMLVHNEVFQVSEEVQGSDGRLYLRLADGRGWAFDDSALMPHDPSVIRGCWAPLSTPSTQSTFASTPASTVWEPMEEPMTPPGAPAMEEVLETKKKRRRRKRGGVKRRPKNKVVAAEATMSEDEVETEAPPSEAEVETDILGSDGGSADARSSSSQVRRTENLLVA
eukprot:gnl/MRDRNA2_/MRDRNA2_29220_c0_seq1.p1 gnl/MRDRNA2_/MRDRNA2_29220_c0~~gnl/MRDRNA2_/MRDRNA2_29220_c0_seq1.p1  ORF type:complete len:418 (+),score=83.61 gnl/MRDRNA2_/MRDRNA2_29220_c0_seq1:119-1372(+)